MSNYVIQRAAVIGSGTMGGALAAHFANAGLDVALLDIVPQTLTPDEEKKKFTLQHPSVRNRIVNAGLQAVLKSKPAALFTPQTAERIRVGNLEDNFDWVAEADWILEAIIENLDVKRALMERIDAARKPESIVTTNTSGIPIHAIAQGRSQSFRQHFLGTHFFNPPRYLKLLEVISGPDTLPAVVTFIQQFGETVLGKGVVICKDRPNFIANRLGSFLGMYTLRYAYENNYRVDEVDEFTGTVIGHPKTATFRLADLVGVDVMYHVAENLYHAVLEDEARAELKPPEFLKTMVERKLLGNKAGQGFYKEVRERSKKKFYALNLHTLEYEPPEKFLFDSVSGAEMYESLAERLRYLVIQEDRAAKFIWDTTARYLAYASHRIPEIADDIVSIDRAMRWGFAHEAGPFEMWDMLGVQATVERMAREDIAVAPWVNEMLATGHATFYQNGSYYDPASKTYKALVEPSNIILLKKEPVLIENENASLRDLGDGVLCLEFHTKLNALDDGIIEIAQSALEQLELDFVGMVIGNQGEHFSAGANVMSIGIAAENGEWDKIDQSVKTLQDFLMRVRYSRKPIVTAPFGYTLGGGCEVAMAGSRIVAHAESYAGLVEVGMGLIPAGGGTKELLRRIVAPAMQTPHADVLPFLQRVFELIGTAKVATSAEEAKQMGFFGSDTRIVMNLDQLIAEAKKSVLDLVNENYQPPTRGKSIYAAGARALAALRLGIYSLLSGRYISEYDAKVGDKLAYVLCGGKISAPAWVEEQYILDLEREAFVSLCGEEKTRERIWHFLNTGKPLRN
ncbi:MAG TPA: 3-hydroxyacyl-CoA dehydrogenase NAD-binding domain-containing protein [Anaerolineae bacterium]|nr:3-hydroxyacyl-CoA dehydrogenase NAD-binding domain-containing protein [Anaerolineae bacterium]